MMSRKHVAACVGLWDDAQEDNFLRVEFSPSAVASSPSTIDAAGGSTNDGSPTMDGLGTSPLYFVRDVLRIGALICIGATTLLFFAEMPDFGRRKSPNVGAGLAGRRGEVE